MAFSLNRQMLIGNLGRDAETRFTNSNAKVTTFSIATTHSYQDKKNEWVNDTTWHNIVAWGISDHLQNLLKKGASFYVEGRTTKRTYEDKNGNTVHVTEVVAEKIIPMEKLNSAQQNSNRNSNVNEEVPATASPSGAEDDGLPF